LAIVVWMLIGASVIVMATQQEALEGQEAAYDRFQRDQAVWAARGGVHYAIGYLDTFAPQPAMALQEKPAADYTSKFKEVAPIGWFIADYPYVAGAEQYGVRSEQARMPLSELTTSAVNVLFGSGQVRQNFLSFVAARRVLGATGAVKGERAQVFRHPFELLGIKEFTLGMLLGQDFNDNGVLEPHETGRPKTAQEAVRAASGLRVDRGIVDIVTAFTDGKFDPYEASGPVRDIYLGDFPGKSEALGAAEGREPPAAIAAGDADWTTFAGRSLTNTSSYFRIQCFGTLRGQPIARATCVVQYMEEDDVSLNWFRIVDWRQDG
jgi:hypothetical protein